MKIVKTANNKKTIKISRSEWTNIGKKAGWIKDTSFRKTAETIEVDGKTYDEINGELVEVISPIDNNPLGSNQASLQTANSYTDPLYKITFTEGEDYTNWFGTYEILKINENGTMDVEYIQSFRPEIEAGDRRNYPISAQAETISKSRKSKEIEMKLNNIANLNRPNEFFSMGVIAANGYISAEIGPKSYKSFPEKYKSVTGESPSLHLNKGYSLSKNDRWSYTLRVHLPTNLPYDILKKMDVPNARQRSTQTEINDNAFIWGLFNNGFSIGVNKANKDKILSFIPENKKQIFLDGFNLTL